MDFHGMKYRVCVTLTAISCQPLTDVEVYERLQDTF